MSKIIVDIQYCNCQFFGVTKTWWDYSLNATRINTQNKRGETPLLLTVKLGHENLVRLLVEHNADVNIPDNDGYKLLQRYVMGGDENLIRFLVEHNADVNIQNIDGYTLLHLLVFKNDENRCRWLLEHNADANIQDK